MRINQVIISVFVHETEDYDKVVRSIEEFFSPEINNSKKSVKNVQGHYGNRIIIVEFKFDRKFGSKLFDKILSKMEISEIMLIISTIDSHWHDGKLYLRFDKQYLIGENRLVLKDGDDVIRVVVSFNNTLENIKEELKKLVSDRILYSKL
ncbi:MAG: RNA-binding domain-containing protein [Saccharolobus sp.]